jgi:hypothetical protein
MQYFLVATLAKVQKVTSNQSSKQRREITGKIWVDGLAKIEIGSHVFEAPFLFLL